MLARPLIIVPADTRDAGGYRWHAAAEPYLHAVVAGLDGIPLILPALGADVDADAVLDRADGVLAPGSRSNVHPSLYGERETPASEPFDRPRDATSLPLIAAALRRGVPLFAICRGMQELNVVLGGSLAAEVHAIAGRDDHRAPEAETQDERFAIRQDVVIEPGGLLHDVLGADAVRVNSLHSQGIDRLAGRLVVEARAADGTIEAVRVADAPGFAVGVQWHPEFWIDSDEASARLFAAFGRAVRDYMGARAGALAG